MGYDFNVTPVQVENGTDYQARKDAAAARKQELQIRQMQIDQAKKAKGEQDARDAAAKGAYQPSSYTPPQTGVNVGGANLGYQPATVQGPAQFNRGSYLQSLQQSDPLGAMDAQQHFQQQDMEAQKQQVAFQDSLTTADTHKLELASKQLDLTARMLGGVKSAPPEIQAQVYQGVRQQAIQMKLVDPNDPQVPEQFPGMEWLDQKLQSTLPIADQIKNELQRREMQSKTVQTAEGVQQFNPGTGRYDQNIGKLPKTVAPGVNVTVGGAGQDVQLIDQKKQPHLFGIAQDLAYGKLTLQQMKSLYGYSRNSSAQRQALYATAQELNPNFDPAQFEMGFKFAANPKVRQQMASLDNVTSGVKDLLKLSDEADRSGVKLFNDLIIKGGAQVSGKKYSNLQTARTAFADELSGALGYGSATDMSREMGFNMTDPNLSAEAFRSAIQDVVVPFVQRKKASLLGQMGPYGGGPTLTNQNPGTGQRPPLGSFEK